MLSASAQHHASQHCLSVVHCIVNDSQTRSLVQCNFKETVLSSASPNTSHETNSFHKRLWSAIKTTAAWLHRHPAAGTCDGLDRPSAAAPLQAVVPKTATPPGLL